MMDEELFNQCQNEASKVEFLTESWEYEWYAKALYDAKLWGTKKSLENKMYFSKNHLIDKYNV